MTAQEFDLPSSVERAALLKIEEETYVICDLVGEDIPVARLEAISYATITVKTQDEKGLIFLYTLAGWVGGCFCCSIKVYFWRPSFCLRSGWCPLSLEGIASLPSLVLKQPQQQPGFRCSIAVQPFFEPRRTPEHRPFPYAGFAAIWLSLSTLATFD